MELDHYLNLECQLTTFDFRGDTKRQSAQRNFVNNLCGLICADSFACCSGTRSLAFAAKSHVCLTESVSTRFFFSAGMRMMNLNLSIVFSGGL
jgi:hypothetical protein